MSLTDELRQLAELHAQGHLSDREFADAKARLLQTDAAPASTASAPAPLPVRLDAPPPAELATLEERTFWSSRWSSGNFFFRDRVTVATDGLHFRKGSLFGADEQHIHYRSIASLKVDHGIFLTNVSVETAGGTQPIFINGLWKGRAKEMQALVRDHQARVMARG